METISLVTINCNGLANNIKRKDYFTKLHEMNNNIYLLQETHWLESEENFIRSGWGGEVIVAGNSKNSGGTAILFNNNFQHKVVKTLKDVNGQYIICSIEFNNKRYTLINLYGPSNGDHEDFFDIVVNNVDNEDTENLLIGGDFNCVLDPILDRKNCTGPDTRPRSRAKIKDIMVRLNLKEVFREFHPDRLAYSWRRFQTNKQCRLDYFLISEELLNDTKSIDIGTSYRSDHSPVILKLKKNAFVRDKLFWKFNNSLLSDPDYVKEIKIVISDCKKLYGALVYNHDTIDSIPLEDLVITISEDIFLETILLQIRGKTISYASYKKKKENEKEKQLETKIENLEHSLNRFNQTELDNLKAELELLRDKRIKGIALRSKVKWITDGEKINKYFCNLESRNYNDKMLPLIELDNGDIIDSQPEIKNEVKKFYENLYKKRNVTDCSFDDLNNLQKQLPNEDKAMLEEDLSIEEVKLAIKNLSLGKSPGPDGFTSEFFKFFILDLGIFILRAANTCFQKGVFTPTFRQGNIVLIPKENKPKRFIKNLRPISLLSTIYKIISTCISNRLKQVLPQLIDESQNAFLKFRNLSSNVRFIYDTLVYTEKEQIPGMLLSIDFEKAFDCISWSFLFKSLSFFNFGPKFIRWIQLFYTDLTSCITINGQNSDWFNIERGVRQGDPSSPYLYLICAEILSLMIKNNDQIKGIRMNNNVNLLSQFADDTTLSLDGTEESLTQAIDTITRFSTYSGLKVNEQKSMIIWIGSRKGSQIRYLRDRNFVWEPGDIFKIVGIKFSTNLETITRINYENKIDEIKQLLNKWKKRNISPIGKIAIIKCMIMSKITHLIMNLPDPDEKFINLLEKELYSFIWDSKPNKIGKATLCKEYAEGGLRMVNVRHTITSLKTSILRKIHTDRFLSNWTENLYPNIIQIKRYGIDFIKKIKKDLNNEFWIDILKHMEKIYTKAKPNNYEEIVTDHLFYNENIIRDRNSIFIRNWAENDILYIHQLMKDNGVFLSYLEFQNKYPNIQTNILDFLGVVRAVKRYVNRFQKPVDFVLVLQSNKPWLWLNKGNKFILSKLNDNQLNPAAILKWNQLFHNINWKKVFTTVYTSTTEVKLRWFQYRIIHRIIPTQRFLYIRKIVGSPLCNFCYSVEQDIDHLFFDCRVVNNFWIELENLLKNNCIHCQGLNISKELVIFGTTNTFHSDKVFDLLLIWAKFFIYKCKLDNITPRFTNFHKILKYRYTIEKLIANKKNNQTACLQDWNLYSKIIS